MFPENIQTHTTEGNTGNSGGVGAQRPRKFLWGEGFEDLSSLPEGTYNDCFSPTFVARSGAFAGHAAFYLPFFNSKRLFLFY